MCVCININLYNIYLCIIYIHIYIYKGIEAIVFLGNVARDAMGDAVHTHTHPHVDIYI